MKNVIEILDRYYQSFIDQPNSRDFFIDLAKYIKYIVETPKMGKIIKPITKERANADKELNKYEKMALEEIIEIKDRLLEKIKKIKIARKDNENLIRLIQNWEDYEERKIGSSESGVEYLCGLLAGFICYLNEGNYKNIVNDFIKTNKQDPNIITEYTCFKNVNLYYKAEEEYEEKEKIELWGAWEKLFLVYEVIFNKKGLLERYKKNRWTYLNLQGIIAEMQKIINSSISDPAWFVKDSYINHARKIHNYFIQELSKEEDKKPEKKKVKETTLYLNQVGELHREPKDRYCYPMGEKSNRHRIIRFLATNKGYQLTEFISTELSIESEKSIRTEIGKMRNNIEKYLKIKSKDFLQGKKESGYRINPKYKVILKNE